MYCIKIGEVELCRFCFLLYINCQDEIGGGVFFLRILFGCDIPKQASIAKSVEFAHYALGVVIHPNSVIGENCFIQHHVTIGVNKGKTGTPKIGKNVFIGPYAMILGDITIGDNAVIGAGTIVMKDIESNSIYTGSSSLIKRGQNPANKKSSVF